MNGSSLSPCPSIFLECAKLPLPIPIPYGRELGLQPGDPQDFPIRDNSDQDQTIAALEIMNVKAEVKSASGRHTSKFSIASLVLADCYQQLGPDFEFILASNRNMSIDVPSGTIIDSGATSPTFEEQMMNKAMVENQIYSLFFNIIVSLMYGTGEFWSKNCKVFGQRKVLGVTNFGVENFFWKSN